MKPSPLHDENYGRPVLIGSSVLLWLLILLLMYNIGYEKTWQLWRVPTEMPPFVDFRLIPGSAESYLRGFEPSVENPFDPRQRIFNYPTFWRVFFYSGVTQEDTVWVSVTMIVLFFVGAFLFPGTLTPPDALAMLLILFSPASMLLYERGNVDLVVFFVCAINIVLAGYSPVLAATGILFGSVMKMFPFFGISILLKESPSRFVRLFGVCTLLFLAYFFVTWESAVVAWDQTMRGTNISYGANVFLDRYAGPLSRFGSGRFSEYGPLLHYGAIAMAALLIALAGISGLARHRQLTASSERNLAGFRMGASIYIGTFLLGNNWDYRLAFLVLVVPQLMQWVRSSSGKTRLVVQLCILCVTLSCWYLMAGATPITQSDSAWAEIRFMLDELINWMLMVTLAYLFIISMPEWVHAGLRYLLPHRRLASSSGG